MNEHRDKRSRSKSPVLSDKRRRQRSKDYDTKPDSKSSAPRMLPFNGRMITKYDLREYRPMFALYLDIQKNLDIEELAEHEVKGRWKSFTNKWNRGELANGWYDPATLSKAVKAQQDPKIITSNQQELAQADLDHESYEVENNRNNPNDDEDEEQEDAYGPSLPQPALQLSTIRKNVTTARSGPTFPSIQDLQSRDEDTQTAAKRAREANNEKDYDERKQENKLQRERLEDLAPRAAAGTRDRQIEKKQDIAASNQAFAASKDAEMAEVQDRDLMGEDTMSELKRLKKEQERRKTEREIRREELLRARMVEREERVRHMREKEDKTMSMLKEIARERFGDGNMQPATLKDE